MNGVKISVNFPFLFPRSRNASMLYSTAIKYLAKDLEDFCFKFCLNHMTAITQSLAFLKLDDDTCKHFIAKAAKNGAFKS